MAWLKMTQANYHILGAALISTVTNNSDGRYGQPRIIFERSENPLLHTAICRIPPEQRCMFPLQHCAVHHQAESRH